MPRAELTPDDLRGINLAWAIAHVPGTALALAGSTIIAFVRDTKHTAPPQVDRIARYVEAGVETFFRPAGATA